MKDCHKAFLNHYPWLTEYKDFNDWLFSEDPTCVAFRRGWAASNDNRISRVDPNEMYWLNVTMGSIQRLSLPIT